MHFLSLLILGLLSFQQPSFRIDAEHIRVPVTVLDENGKTIPDLVREDFVLYDEGDTRPIRNFVLDQSPVHVVFLLDMSGSVTEELREIRYATLRFAQAFDREDRISIISFSDDVEVLQDWTNDYGDLRKSTKKLKRGYRTALYDALLQTANEKLQKVAGKKVIILLTDGLDNESVSTYENVKGELISSNVVLYIVSRTRLVREQVEQSDRVEFLDRVMKNVLDDDQSFVDIYFREKETAMNHLAEINGGRAFYPQQLEDLGASYLKIARELKTQYVLTFLPPTDSPLEFRKIEVQCEKPVGEIYHREIYRVPTFKSSQNQIELPRE